MTLRFVLPIFTLIATGHGTAVAPVATAPGGSAATNTTASSGPSYADPSAVQPVVGPPMGPLEQKLTSQWNAASILTTMSSNGEGDSKDRFALQQALTGAAPEQTALLTAMQPQADSIKSNLITWTGKVTNITNFLTADASAGGLLATSRSLMQQLPQTQKLLSSTMTQQLQNLAQDTLAMEQTIGQTDTDYSSQIQAQADTVKALFATQDSKFATMTQQQAAAMQQTANSLNVSASNTLKGIGQNATTAVNTAGSITATASTGSAVAKSALSDASDALGGVQADFSASVTSQVANMTANLTTFQDSSVTTLSTSGDQTVAGVTAAAMAAATAIANNLTKTDTATTRLINGVLTTVQAGTDAIGASVTQSTATTNRLISQTGSSINGQITAVQQQSTLSMGDVSQQIADSQALLSQQGTLSGSISSDYSTNIAKLLPLMTSQFSSVTNQAKSVAGDVTSGSGGELMHLNDLIAALSTQSGSQSGDLATRMAALLAQSQQGQAAGLAQTQGGIDNQTNSLQTAMSGVSKSGIQRAGDLNNTATTLGNTLGGSIADLTATISDTTGSGSDAMSQIASGLGGQASDTFSSLVETLRGMNQDGSDAKENFISTLLGPSSDSASQSFASMSNFLATLLNSATGLSSGQADAMAQLRAMQQANGNQTTTLLQSMKGVSGLNQQLSSAVGAQAQQYLTAAQAQMAAALRNNVLNLTGQSRDSLATVDNLINGQSGPASSATMNSVAQSLAASSANMDSVSHDFNQADQAQLQSLTGLSAMAISVLGQSAAQSSDDKQQTNAALANARANIVSQFQAIAANSTNTQMGAAMLALAQSGNSSAIIQYLLSDVSSAMRTINQNAAVGRDVNDRKKAQFQSYVDAQQAQLQTQQAAIVVELKNTIGSVQAQLANKTQMLNGTQEDMEATLDDIRDKVVQAQTTLGQNLQLYQAKLNDIIGEIRSYMNLSADADELAIRQDISNQLAKANGTEVAIATANAAVSDQLASQQASQNSTGSSSFTVVNGVIDGAVAMTNGVADAHASHTDNLIGVAASVDGATSDLNGQLGASSDMMQAGIAGSASAVGTAVTRGEANGAKVIDQLNQKSTDVASQSRKSYIRNLERMGSVDDDTVMVSKQLASLLGNSDSTISDISASTISHLDLSSKTLASLNAAGASKVATVSDVMGAFTSVVLSFLNETGITMETVMGQLNAIEDGSKVKLGQVSTRSQDELNWVSANLNSTSDTYNLFMDQERAIQAAMQTGVQNVQDKLATEPTDQLSDINDSMDSLKQSVGQSQADQLSKVRAWINSRDPAVAKSILTPDTNADSSSFVALRDIRRRLRAVHSDIVALTV